MIPKVDDRVRDNEGRRGVVVGVCNEHNIYVKYDNGSGVGLHCMDKSCAGYDPLYIIGEKKKMDKVSYFKCDQCDKIKPMKSLVKIPVVIGIWCGDLKKTVRTSREKWICTKCNNELLS